MPIGIDEFAALDGPFAVLFDKLGQEDKDSLAKVRAGLSVSWLLTQCKLKPMASSHPLQVSRACRAACRFNTVALRTDSANVIWSRYPQLRLLRCDGKVQN